MRTGETLDSSLGDKPCSDISRIALCPFHAAAPAMYEALKRLAEKTRRANSIQHSGGRLIAEDWAELYQLTNESFTALAKAEGR